MARKLIIPLSAAIAGALITASPASAVTCDGLQSALDGAASGATVTVDEGLSCTGSFDLPSRPITLAGAGSGATLRGDGESRILTGDNVGRTVIRNLRFTGGRTNGGGGAIYVTGNSPITVEGSTFTDNDASDRGGAIFVNPFDFGEEGLAREPQGDEPSGVRIADSTFGGDDGEGNTSDTAGGAVAVLLFPLDVEGTEFIGNTAGYGGGGGLAAQSFSSVRLAGNTFEANEAGTSGGGASIGVCDEGIVEDNVFEANTVQPASQPSFQAAGIQGGFVEGAGLWADGGCFESRRERVAEGKGPEQGRLLQTGNLFVGNIAAAGAEGEADGAGEWVNDLALDSTDDTFHANRVTGTAASGSGGGLRYEDGEGAVLRNLVATANTMPAGEGGGIAYDAEGTTLQLVHATIAANAIGEGRGSAIWGGDFQSLVVDNSIVHGNTGGPELAGFEAPDDVDRTTAGVALSGIELRSSLGCAGGAAYPGEGNLCADPKLAGAAGGDVHQTAASPTLEKASAELAEGLATDYEGQARSLDHDRADGAQPDMGADEAPAPAPVTDDQQQPAPAAGGGVLGTQSRSCSSRRSFRIKLRNRGQKVVKATVIVNGKRVKVLRGKRLTSRVDLRGLPKGRYSVRIRLRLANGKVLSGVRRYYTCRAPRRSGPPPV